MFYAISGISVGWSRVWRLFGPKTHIPSGKQKKNKFSPERLLVRCVWHFWKVRSHHLTTLLQNKLSSINMHSCHQTHQQPILEELSLHVRVRISVLQCQTKSHGTGCYNFACVFLSSLAYLSSSDYHN